MEGQVPNYSFPATSKFTEFCRFLRLFVSSSPSPELFMQTSSTYHGGDLASLDFHDNLREPREEVRNIFGYARSHPRGNFSHSEYTLVSIPSPVLSFRPRMTSTQSSIRPLSPVSEMAFRDSMECSLDNMSGFPSASVQTLATFSNDSYMPMQQEFPVAMYMHSTYPPQHPSPLLEEVNREIRQITALEALQTIQRISISTTRMGSSAGTIVPRKILWTLQRPSLGMTRDANRQNPAYSIVDHTFDRRRFGRRTPMPPPTYSAVGEGQEQVLVDAILDTDRMGTYQIWSVPVKPLKCGTILLATGKLEGAWIYKHVLKFDGEIAYIWCKNIDRSLKKVTFMRIPREFLDRSTKEYLTSRAWEETNKPGGGTWKTYQERIGRVKEEPEEPTLVNWKEKAEIQGHKNFTIDNSSRTDAPVKIWPKGFSDQQLRPDSVEAAYERKGWTYQHPQYDPLFDGQMFASNPLLLEIAHRKRPRTVDGHEQFTLTAARDSKYEQLFEAISIPIRQISCGDWVEFSGGITGRWKLARKEEQRDGFDYMACENHELQIWIRKYKSLVQKNTSSTDASPVRERKLADRINLIINEDLSKSDEYSSQIRLVLDKYKQKKKKTPLNGPAGVRTDTTNNDSVSIPFNYKMLEEYYCAGPGLEGSPDGDLVARRSARWHVKQFSSRKLITDAGGARVATWMCPFFEEHSIVPCSCSWVLVLGLVLHRAVYCLFLRHPATRILGYLTSSQVERETKYPRSTRSARVTYSDSLNRWIIMITDEEARADSLLDFLPRSLSMLQNNFTKYLMSHKSSTYLWSDVYIRPRPIILGPGENAAN
ncbi:hypothetical protein C8R43DRAFT_956092 [Mycena crocata]|nr:hypothetical protein C8R43DRAFT_956092 [Mycena crocata]